MIIESFYFYIRQRLFILLTNTFLLQTLNLLFTVRPDRLSELWHGKLKDFQWSLLLMWCWIRCTVFENKFDQFFRREDEGMSGEKIKYLFEDLAFSAVIRQTFQNSWCKRRCFEFEALPTHPFHMGIGVFGIVHFYFNMQVKWICSHFLISKFQRFH